MAHTGRCLPALAFFVWNICIRQGRTGATVGKSVLAIRPVNDQLQTFADKIVGSFVIQATTPPPSAW